MATASRSSSRRRTASRGAARCRFGDDLHQGHVPHAVVAGAVRAGDPGAVQHDGDPGLVQGHVHEQLVEGAVQEGRVDADHRVQPAEGQAGGGGHGVLFGDADVEDALRVAFGHGLQAHRLQHGPGDRHDVLALVGDVGDFLAEDRGPGTRAEALATGSPVCGSMTPTAWNWSASSARAGA